jgi:hypothetical protein
MKCCPPTPNANTGARIETDAGAARAARSTLQAVIFADILKPLAAGLGPAGETAVENVAQQLFAPVRP